MSGEELEAEILAIVRRRMLRDSRRLRTPKLYFLRNFADDTQEWVIQETKDILLVCEHLMQYNNQSVNLTIVPLTERALAIRKTYVRKVISPLRKTEKGVRNEAEHWMRFRQVVEPAINLILELLSMRPTLEAAVNQAAGVEVARKFRPPGVA